MDKFPDLKYQEKRLFENIDEIPEKEQQKIKNAYEFAKEHHKGQKRDEGTPYTIHLLRVANLLIEELNIKDPNIISAAILHDVVEDTDADLDQINKTFSNEIARLVKNLTRIKKPDETLYNRYERKLAKFKETMQKDYNSRAIKACDILDNMMSWKYIPEDHPSRKKFDRWFKETKTMNIPLAKSVDEDLAKKMKNEVENLKNSLNSK